MVVPVLKSTVISAQEALDRIGGMQSLYVILLQEFLLDLDRVVPEYGRLQMHTLKGTAATLGAMELSVLAFELEQRCKGPADALMKDTGATQLQALVALTRVAVQEVLASFEKPTSTGRLPESLQQSRDTVF